MNGLPVTGFFIGGGQKIKLFNRLLVEWLLDGCLMSQAMRRADRIANQGSRAAPNWMILGADPTHQRR